MGQPNFHIVPLTPRNGLVFGEHVATHMLESGEAGTEFAVARHVDADEVRRAAIARWERSLNQPGWGRTWGLWEDQTEPQGAAKAALVGHIELRGGRVPAELHRAVLGMGILRTHTGCGQGRRLVATALRWAVEDAGLSYVDLGVFANNARARRLYEWAGFEEIGRTPDAFRLESGTHIEDVRMTLRLSSVRKDVLAASGS